MSWRILLVAVLFLGGLVAEEAYARGKRVSQIPNGAVFSCKLMPHGRRRFHRANAFWIGNRKPTFSPRPVQPVDVLWAPELAALDSDGDGASNGAELGDPDGTWVAGDTNPEGEAFAPGDPTSTPPPTSHDTAVEVSTWAQIKHLIGTLD